MQGELEFDCGTVVKGIGAPAMAIKAHMAVCTDKDCIVDCAIQYPKYANSIL